MAINNGNLAKAKVMVANQNRQSHGIGTLSEKTLHVLLKYYYAPNEDMHEIPIERYVADIYTGEEIIEIQTAQFNKMWAKLDCFLPLYPVTICHPIPRKKQIIVIDEETGEEISCRKSPQTGTPYHGFIELYRIKQFLKHPNLKIKFVLVDVEEYRLWNGAVRGKRKVLKRQDRIPLEIVEEVGIECINDYLQFLPIDLPESFTSSDYAKVVKINRELAQIVLNILNFLEVVERIGKRGRSYLYKVVEGI